MPAKAITRTSMALMAALGVVGSGACAHVGQEDFDAGLAGLRADLQQEIRQGDDAVAQRVNGLDGRVDQVEARLAQLEQDIQTLENEFGVTVERLETALRFNVPVYFGFDAAEINPDARVVLERFGDVVQEYYPEAMITVEGFTDPSGPAAYNKRLGQRRADAVRGYLVEGAGLTDARVRAVSYGEDTSRLVAPGDTGPGSEGWQNRRVVMVIDHNGAMPAPVITEQQGIG